MSETQKIYMQRNFTVSDKHLDKITCLAFSRDGSHLAIASGQELGFFRLRARRLIAVLPGHAQITSLRWLADTTGTLVCAYVDGLVMHVELKGNDLTLVGFRTFHPIDCMDVTSNCTRLATGHRGVIRIWNRVQGDATVAAGWVLAQRISNPYERITINRLQSSVVGLHWLESTAQSHTLLVAYRHHGVQLWNASTGNLISVVCEMHQPIFYTSISPCFCYVMLGTKQHLTVIDISSRSVSVELKTNCPAALPGAFIHGGTAMVCGWDSAETILYKLVGNPERIQTLSHPNKFCGPASALCAFVDVSSGTWIIAIATSKQVMLWDAVEVEEDQIGTYQRSLMERQLHTDTDTTPPPLPAADAEVSRESYALAKTFVMLSTVIALAIAYAIPRVEALRHIID